jgi:hypothetical protein
VIGNRPRRPLRPALHLQIDSAGSNHAIAGLSPVLFSGTGSEGEGLQYLIEFGDGGYTTAPFERHPCRVQNTTWGFEQINGRLTVVDRFGRISITSRSFSCGLLTNNLYPWINWWYESPTREHRSLFIDSHLGTNLTGYYDHPGGGRSRLTGTLSGERNVRLALEGGGIEFTGEVFLDSTWPCWGSYLLLTLKGGSADGQTLKFRWISSATYC